MNKEMMEKAFELMPEKAEAKVLNGNFKPYFIGDNRFVYVKESFDEEAEKVNRYKIYHMDDGSEVEAFCHDTLASLLEEVNGDEVSSNKLPINFETIDEENKLVFSFQNQEKKTLRFKFDGKKLEQIGLAIPQGATLSPDKTKAVYGQKGNLYLIDLKTGVEKALTTDGQEEDGYGIVCASSSGVVGAKLKGKALPLGAFWSDDGRYIFTYRMDLRKVEKLALVQSVPQGRDAVRPVLFEYHYPLPGDPHLPMVEYYFIQVDENNLNSFGLGQFAFSGMMPATYGDSIDGRYTVFHMKNRQNTVSKIFIFDHEEETVSHFFDEVSPTFNFNDHHKMQNMSITVPDFAKRKYHLSEKLNTMFWLSERKGFFDIYAYDLGDGSCKQLTENYTVRQLLNLDEENELLYFNASNVGLPSTLYHKHPYVLDLKTGKITCLRPEAGDHATYFCPDGEYYLDAQTNYNQEPVVTLYKLSGEKIREVVKADATKLREAGWVEPVPFTAKGADGETDITGMLYFPADYDENKLYPVVEYCYGGNQKMLATQTFMETLSRHAGYTQVLANLGFICTIIDGRGTPLRGKAFHDHCYNNMGDCAGLEDHAAVYPQLKEMYPGLDIERVGVWGHSGGGFATFHYMVKHPDLYKVGVSTAGNHAQEIYSAGWSELFMEPFNKELWEAQNAEHMAEKLEGHLFLIHGDLDDNVHPAGTMRVVDALIEADKDFDLLLIPNRHHDLHDHPYYRRRLIEYFIKHLQP